MSASVSASVSASLSPSRVFPCRLSPSRLSPSRLSPSRLSPSCLRRSRLSPSCLRRSRLSPSRLSPYFFISQYLFLLTSEAQWAPTGGSQTMVVKMAHNPGSKTRGQYCHCPSLCSYKFGPKLGARMGYTKWTHPGVEFGTEFVETQKETIVFASCRFCRCLCSPVAVLVGACVRQLPFWSVLVFASCRFGRCLCSSLVAEPGCWLLAAAHGSGARRW